MRTEDCRARVPLLGDIEIINQLDVSANRTRPHAVELVRCTFSSVFAVYTEQLPTNFIFDSVSYLLLHGVLALNVHIQFHVATMSRYRFKLLHRIHYLPTYRIASKICRKLQSSVGVVVVANSRVVGDHF